MAVKGHRYLSFLLRLWLVKGNGNVAWRASLEDPHTCERQGFASLATLMDFLKEQIQEGHDEDRSNLVHEEKQT